MKRCPNDGCNEFCNEPPTGRHHDPVRYHGRDSPHGVRSGRCGSGRHCRVPPRALDQGLKAVLETTKWSGDLSPNHAYLLDGDKIMAYQPAGGAVVYLSGAMRLRAKGRTFQSIPARSSPFRKGKPVAPATIEVVGSKGDRYFLDPAKRTCTCPGFTFRGACKHLERLP